MFADTERGQARRLAYYEARKLDAGRLTVAEKRAPGPSRARRH
jgi:hypothetical protein